MHSPNQIKRTSELYHPITAVLDELSLHCEIDPNIQLTGNVTWTLHRGDFNPRRASEPRSGGRKVTLPIPDMTDCFVARAVTEEGAVYESNWVQAFSTDTRERYREWQEAWRVHRPDLPSRVPLFRYEEPFQNILLVCHNTHQDMSGVRRLAIENGLTAETHPGVHWDRLTIFGGARSAADSNGARFLFSGVTRNSSRLLFGQDEVEEFVPDVSALRDEVGEFHLLSWSPGEISFGNDFIGLGHIFYYHSKDLFVAANGVHLLALALRKLGVALEIDTRTVKSRFFATSVPFETQAGVRADFTGVRRLSVYEEVRITQAGFRTIDTELRRTAVDGELSDELYESLLHQAKGEIADNLAIALDHPRFENVVVELSAGLDSRIIYSALTTLPRSDKVRIRTRDTGEKSVAAAINNLYRFPWDDLPRVRSYDWSDGKRQLPVTSHSVFMDGYYIESMHKARESYGVNCLLITGHCGEAFSRTMFPEGYFARNWQDALPGRPRSIDEVRAELFRCIGVHQVWYEAGEAYFSAILDECLAMSPSSVFSRQFDDMYVSERNPMVGGSVYRGAMSAPQWRPLQSKALFRLKTLWFQHELDYRIQYDLIRAFNPLVSEVRYLKPIERLRLREYEQYRNPFPISRPIKFDESVDELDRARAASDEVSIWLPSKSEFDAATSAIRVYEDSAESFLVPLGYILSLSSDFEEMGLPVFSYVERALEGRNGRMFAKRHNIRNKLHILLQELLIANS